MADAFLGGIPQRTGKIRRSEVALNAVIALCEGKEDEFSKGFLTLAREQLGAIAGKRDGKVKGKRGHTKIKPGLKLSSGPLSDHRWPAQILGSEEG